MFELFLLLLRFSAQFSVWRSERIYSYEIYPLSLSRFLSVVYYRSVAGLQVTRCTLTGSLVSFRAVYKKKKKKKTSQKGIDAFALFCAVRRARLSWLVAADATSESTERWTLTKSDRFAAARTTYTSFV